jgi:hypothetical protein
MAVLLCLCACNEAEPSRLAGGWTDTETGPKVAGLVKREDGSPAAGALVLLRPDDYLGTDPTGADTLGRAESGGTILDALCDSTGSFTFDSVAMGEYVVEARDREIKAAAIRFKVDRPKGRFTLDASKVRSMGAIAGRVGFSDGSPGRVLVRIFGLERAALTDASGAYFFGNVPAGEYTLHFSGLDPFILPADSRSLPVNANTTTSAGETALERAPKQSFRIVDGALEIPGVDSTNPVLFENGAFQNPEDGSYLWAKASLGRLDLRGTIVSYGKDSGAAAIQVNMANCAKMIRMARNGGMRNLKDPVAGSRRPLQRAPGGRLEDIKPDGSDGAKLVVAEARRATPERPLVFFSGANLTTAAEALLIDPAIADRMIVFGTNNDNYNIGDSLALALVAKKGRFVAWARDYIFPKMPRKPLALLPANRLGEIMRSQYQLDTGSSLTSFAFYGDFGAATFLYRRAVWRGASASDVKGPPLKAAPSARAAYDFIDIPAADNDWQAIEDEFFTAVGDSGAYHPWPVPGRIEAEAYRAASAMTVDSSAEEKEDVAAWKGPGGWAEYSVDVAASGDYALSFRYKADVASGLRILDAASGTAVAVDMPASAWTGAEAVLHLDSGRHVLRVECVQGALEWNRMDAARK